MKLINYNHNLEIPRINGIKAKSNFMEKKYCIWMNKWIAII